MNNLFNLFSTEFVAALGWSLLHSLWQGALIALLLGIALLFLQKRSSNLRYTIAVSGLGLTLVAFFGTFAYLYQSASAQSAALEEQIFIVTQDGYENLVQHSAEGQTLLSIFLDYFNQHLPIIVVFWCLGVLVLSLRFLGGLAFLQRLRHNQNQPLGADWEGTMNAIAAQIGVEKSVQLVESALIKVPMVVGYLKPMILLPIGTVNALSAAEVEAILAHELAHIKRHDYIINLIQSIIDVLFFYHPAIWWMSSTVRAERENCCDDLALSVTGNSLIIAKALANLEALRQRSYQLSLAFTGNKNQLLKRISRLLGQPMKRNNHFVEGIVAIVIILLCMTTINYRVDASSNEDNAFVASIEIDTTKPTDEIIFTDEDGEVIEEYIIIEEETEVPSLPLTAAFPTAINMNELENTWFSTDFEFAEVQRPELAYFLNDAPKKLELAKFPEGLTWTESSSHPNTATFKALEGEVIIDAPDLKTTGGKLFVQSFGENSFVFTPSESNTYKFFPKVDDFKVDVQISGDVTKDYFKTITVSPDTSILDDAEVIIIDGDKVTIIRKKKDAADVEVELDRMLNTVKELEERERVKILRQQKMMEREMELAKRQIEIAKRQSEREMEVVQRRLEAEQRRLERESEAMKETIQRREEEMLRRAEEMEKRAKLRAKEIKVEQKQRAIEMEVRAKERAKELEIRAKMREKEMKEREKYLKEKEKLRAKELEKTQKLHELLIKDGFLKEGEELKTINISKDNDKVSLNVNGKKIPDDKAKEYIEQLELGKSN